jgi:serine/threonine-protein kinase HipA
MKYAKDGKMLYLIGENLDSDRAHSLAKTGRIVKLMRGIYADAAEDGPAL